MGPGSNAEDQGLRQAGDRGGEVHVVVGQLRVFGIQLGHALWRVDDLPQGGGHGRDGAHYLRRVVLGQVREYHADRVGQWLQGRERGQLETEQSLDRHVAFQVQRRVGEDVAQERAVLQRAAECLRDAQDVARRQGLDLGTQDVRPVSPRVDGQVEVDVLAGLEVPEQRGLVHADLARDVRQADVAYPLPHGELESRIEDGGL